MQIASGIWTKNIRCSNCSIPVALIVQIASELWSKNARSKIQAQKTQKMNPLIEVICLAFRVVAWGVRRSSPKCEFSMLLVVLWHCKTGPWRESCESTRKLWVFVFQRCGNAPFRPERPIRVKSERSEGWTYPNRPSRFRWREKIGNPFALSGGSLIFRRFRELEFHLFARSEQTTWEIGDLKVGLT